VDFIGSSLDPQRLTKILAKAANHLVTGVRWERQMKKHFCPEVWAAAPEGC
jgi:hypothetical protein